MKSTNENKQLFVYGTLRGMFPPVQLNDQLNATAISLGSFPAIISLGSEYLLEGDVVSVTEAELKQLDRYEGVDVGLYKRDNATTVGGLSVIVYVFAEFLSRWEKNPGLDHQYQLEQS